MPDETNKADYELYYDESNNMQSFSLDGSKFNIDNDPVQKVSPIFVLAGIGRKESMNACDFKELIPLFGFQSSIKNIKFKKMFKKTNELKASLTPTEAFKQTLDNNRFSLLFRWLLNNEIFIHFFVLNTAHWAFLDIIEDIVAYTDNENIASNERYYKDCLYDLFKNNKSSFLSLMNQFGYPNIKPENSTEFLEHLFELTRIVLSSSELTLDTQEYLEKVQHLSELFEHCLLLYWQKTSFDLVFQDKPHRLINRFDFFYERRIEDIPQSSHFFDSESGIMESINNRRKLKGYEDGTSKSKTTSNYKFIYSHENLPIQLSDVVAGFTRKLFSFLDDISIKDIETFKKNLNHDQNETLRLFKKLMECSQSIEDKLLYRVIPHSVEVRASALFA